ncbi:MAG: hypothetical protein ABI395_10625 [Sphingobium sp.]
MYDVIATVASIPYWALVPITIAGLLLLIIALRNVEGRAAHFALVAIWLRIIFDAYFKITIAPIGGGMTLNALLSIATVVVGLVAIDRRNLLIRWMLPVYGLLIAVLLSHAVNGDIKGALNGVFKAGYLIVLILAVYEGLQRNGRARFSGAMLWVVAMLLLLQGAAVGLGVKLVNDIDHSITYAGGFGHEANFSVALTLAYLPTMFAANLSRFWRLTLVILFTLCLLFANYRTMLIPILPFVAFYCATELMKIWDKRSRPAMIIGVTSLGVLALFAGAISAGDRLNDFYTLASNPGQIIRPTASFTSEERRAGSGRSYVWSYYFEEYTNSAPLQKLVGKGTDSWGAAVVSGDDGAVRAYPQNEFVAYLHDYGLFGFTALALFLGNLIWLSLRSDTVSRSLLLVLNLVLLLVQISTMPLWLMEGVLLYGLIGGYALYGASQTQRPGRRAEMKRSSDIRWRQRPKSIGLR